MARKPFRIALLVVLSTVALALLVGGFFAYRIYTYPTTRHGGRGVEVEITIKRGMNFPQVTKLLAAKRRHRSPVLLPHLRHAPRRHHRGEARRLRAARQPDAGEVLDTLVAGVPERTVSVTLPEGKHMLEFFKLLEEAGVAKAADLEVLGRDPAFLTAHAITGDTVDGYLFPDTYNFVTPTSPTKVIERLINAHRRTWNELAREHARS
jgi:UPF0755 protein